MAWTTVGVSGDEEEEPAAPRAGSAIVAFIVPMACPASAFPVSDGKVFALGDAGWVGVDPVGKGLRSLGPGVVVREGANCGATELARCTGAGWRSGAASTCSVVVGTGAEAVVFTTATAGAEGPLCWEAPAST